MAKNQSREFATMTEEERRRFEQEPASDAESGDAPPDELAMDDPRDEDRMGRKYASLRDEIADPEHRDGLGAQLNDESHQRALPPEE
jgi:hypothetical protein